MFNIPSATARDEYTDDEWVRAEVDQDDEQDKGVGKGWLPT